MVATKRSHLIILAQSLEQPRIVKRIIEKSSEYSSIDVLGFKRQIHAVKNYSLLEDYDNIKVSLVGSISDRKYVKRIQAYIGLLFFIYKKYGFKSKHFYVFGIDLRIISAFTINKKVDYEISDIMWLYKKSFIKFFLRSIDRFLAGMSNTVTFTSEGFYLNYYKKHVAKKKAIIKENKFKTYGKVRPVEAIITDKLRVAYIGSFRYEQIINSLLKIISKNDRICLNFYGDGNGKIVSKMKSYSDQYKNITFNGPFKNPDDLEKIYSGNNLNFVVYDNQLANERVAMPNKYYESGFFNIPIVCANNTYVGKRVIENGMGWITDIFDQDLKKFLESLSMKDLEACHKRIKLLDKTQFTC